jgi:periplasmic divalent cation tolerance protein
MTCQVTFVTCKNMKEAEAIARALVGERLAVCVNVVPRVTSIFRWMGKVCRDAEALLVIKSRAAQAKAIERRVKELHGYSVPEVIHVKIAGGNREYLDWVMRESGPTGRGRASS